MAFGESVNARKLLCRLQLEHLILLEDVVDLGCGPEAVSDEALGVNTDGLPGVTIPGGRLGPRVVARNVDAQADQLRDLGRFDTVFSSHCLEHLPSPISRNLAYWLSLVKIGGWLILYLPDERYYQFDPTDPKRRNPEHLHYLTMDTFEWHLLQLAGAKIYALIPDVDVRHGRYSFLAIIERIS